MQKTISIEKYTWIDCVEWSESEIKALTEKYGFHELDQEAILEENQTARVDAYDSYLFIVLHFPKYDQRTKRYILNELDIFLTRDTLISFRYLPSRTIDQALKRYSEGKYESGYAHPGYMLYDIIDGMLDKTFRMLERMGKELKNLEHELFVGSGEKTIREIMIKKRNIIALKHMIKPQLRVLKLLELKMKTLFAEEIEVYFENLEDKVEKIYGETELMQENVESMEITLRSIVDMQTNATIKYLTVFSAFMLPLTLITSFFGMNIAGLPFSDILVYSSVGATVCIMALGMWLLNRSGKL